MQLHSFRARLLGAALLGAALLAPLASEAFARGPGTYTVKGTNPGGRGGYAGTASLVQTGENTWRLTWRIGNQSWTGWGIGDGQVIAVNYVSGGTSGVILMIGTETGGYKAIWANSGSTDVGAEEWEQR